MFFLVFSVFLRVSSLYNMTDEKIFETFPGSPSWVKSIC
nr:MAG TPA: hypothetical protein [Caudoviricetes sp.]